MPLILNPVAAPRAADVARAPHIAELAGKTVGILTNRWQSMDRMAERMALRLKERYRVREVRHYNIPINGAMAESVKTAVIAECDAVVVGLAN